MDPAMRLSVIIPFYHDHPHLQDCLTSITRNLGVDHEIILVDDASVDTSYQSTLTANNLTLLSNKEKKGPSHARNRGLEAATGDYIVFVDSDDLITNSVSPLFETLHTQTNNIGDVDLLIGERHDAPLPAGYFSTPNRITCLEANPRLVRINSFTSILYRRDFLRKHAISFDEELAISEDPVFLAKCFSKACEILVDRVPFYFYRERPQSRSRAPLNTKHLESQLLGMHKIAGCYKGYSEALALRCVTLFSGNFQFFKRVASETSASTTDAYFDNLGSWARTHLSSARDIKYCLDTYHIHWTEKKAALLKALLSNNSGASIRQQFF